MWVIPFSLPMLSTKPIQCHGCKCLSTESTEITISLVDSQLLSYHLLLLLCRQQVPRRTAVLYSTCLSDATGWQNVISPMNSNCRPTKNCGQNYFLLFSCLLSCWLRLDLSSSHREISKILHIYFNFFQPHRLPQKFSILGHIKIVVQ